MGILVAGRVSWRRLFQSAGATGVFWRGMEVAFSIFFGEHLSHTDGPYFAVTVFSTVGFGDITAKTEGARLAVTGQMIADLTASHARSAPRPGPRRADRTR